MEEEEKDMGQQQKSDKSVSGASKALFALFEATTRNRLAMSPQDCTIVQRKANGKGRRSKTKIKDKEQTVPKSKGKDQRQTAKDPPFMGD